MVRSYGCKWTAAEHALLRELYATATWDELQKRLWRSPSAIRKRAKVLGLIRPYKAHRPDRQHEWTPIRLAFRIAEAYPKRIPEAYQLVDRFDISIATAYRYIRHLKDARGIA